MTDPFAPNSKSSMLRDAQVGLFLVAVMLGLFVYVAFYRITGQGRQIPDHVRMAPVATAVWPHGSPEAPTREAPHDRQLSRAVAATNPPSLPSVATRPRSSSFVQAPNQAATETQIASPEPLRTDRKIAPVDFQTVDSSSKASTTADSMTTGDQVISRLGYKRGDAIEESRIKKAGTDVRDLFGGRLNGKTPKIVVRPPSLPTRPDTEFAPMPKVVKDTTAPTAHTKRVANDFASVATKTAPKPLIPPVQPSHSQPAKSSIFEQSANPSPSQRTAKAPVKRTPQKVSAPTVAANTNSLRSGSVAPHMVPSRPLPRAERMEPEQAFRPVAKSFQPTATQIASSEPQDIAKSAQVISFHDTEHVPDPTTHSFDSQNVKTTSAEPDNSVPTYKNPKPDHDEYVTQKGDSFWSIATEHYQDGRLFDALYRWNADTVTTFDNLPKGTVLEIPDQKTLTQRWPDLCPKKEKTTSVVSTNHVSDYDLQLSERLYITGKGDTLFDIAAKRLGQASRYFDIMRLNDQRLPAGVSHLDPLEAGIRLMLP